MPTALITGPTSGLGHAFATALADRGNDLVLVARDAERLTSLADQLSAKYGIDCETLPADLADASTLRHIEDRLASASPPIDTLVNNAGFGLGTGFLASSLDDEQRLLDVLVRAVLRLTKAALPGMVERGSGTVLNVSSVAGFAPYGTYGAAKAWVTSFSESVAGEVDRHGVRVLAVCPGFIRTEFHERADISMKRLPGFMWLSAEQVVDATLRHLDTGRTSPVLVPTKRYRLVTFAARHAPRGQVRRVTRGFRPRRPEPSSAG